MAREELNSISVLRRLPEFGVHLLPAELRAMSDRSLVLRRVMESRGDSVAPYKRLGDVLELARLLGKGGKEQQMQVGAWLVGLYLVVTHILKRPLSLFRKCVSFLSCSE